MSIPDAAMTAPSPPQDAVVPTKQLDIPEHTTSAQSPRLPLLDALAASASSPNNDMSPAHPPTESSSRHSTPATSAAGSDHAQSTSQSNQIPSSKLPHQPTVEQPTAAQQTAPQPSTSPPPHDQHTLASIQPAYFYPADGSTSSSHDGIPVFEPTMQEFQDFYAFCQAIDTWGMQYGIVKVVAPKEWRDSLPDLRPLHQPNPDPSSDAEQDEFADISKVRIRNAITQHFTPAGSGVWRQTNITRTAKVWNAKQWADTCISEGQKGPEMDRMKWKVEVEGVSNGGWGPKNIGTKDSATSAILEEDGVRTRSGKARPSAVAVVESKSNGKRKRIDEDDDTSNKSQDGQLEEPTTPALAPASPSSPERRSQRIVQSAVKTPPTCRDASPVKPKKNWEAEATTHDEWCAFDYKNCWRKEALSSEQIAQLNGNPTASTSKLDTDFTESATHDQEASTAPPTLPSPSEWTPEVCREIESEYWRSLNFGKPPMYGADLKGTLFDDRTQHWNVGKLDNVLTRLRLRRKLPGVNTPYLYWGMWRATFAWHVEDMDLYSINYIHFGAPKQWYAIRQADRQRFESAMAGAFPSDSRRCPHFMRHKSYLASPSFLASHGIRPLKLVHNAGEFVITYPYGYHSGFNMGYNCAESVNFALESWLDIGRKANYCHCDQSQNSVRIDVDAMLEESKEMEELERKRELRRAKEDTVRAIEEEELEKRRIKNEKAKERRKQKKEAEEEAAAAASAAVPAVPLPFQGGDGFYVDSKETATSPCVFCPANVHVDLVPTPADIPSTNPKLKAMADRHAHRLCASFVPETWVGKQGKAEVVCGIEGIDKARFSLKCQICPNPALQKLYPKIQCTRGKCPRSAHVSCALVEDNGWFVDVCPGETADRLEGKKTPTNTQQADGLEDGERLVVLCKTHNPLFREAEEARKADELRERIHSLPIPSMVKIKTSGGMFQALMVDVSEEVDEITIEDEGRPSTVKFQQIILDSPAEEVAVKEEPPAPAMASIEVAVAADGGDAAPPAKRRRKASEKASANAKAASEEAVEASIAAAAAADADAAVPAPAPKRTRKPRAKAEPAATETIAELPAVDAPKTTPAKKAMTGPAEPKSKPKRQPKKKAQAVQPASAAEVVTPPLDAQQLPQPPVSWAGHPSQHLQQPQQHQPQPQALPPATKRGPRATYAAQPPGSQQHFAEHHPQFQQQHHHQHQQQQYPGPEYGQIHRNPSYPSNGDAVQYGSQYGPSHSSGYPSRDYDPEAERHHMASRYAHSSVSVASPNYGHPRPSTRHPYGAPSPYPPYQQHPAYPHPAHHAPPDGSVDGHTPQSRHSALAASSSSPAPPLMSSATSTPSSASQYGYIAAPPAGYRDRSPPLPTYAKPLAHQPQHLPNGDMHGYPDYRPPYHHPLHPSYQPQQQGQHFRPQQQQYAYGADTRSQQHHLAQQGARTRYTDEASHHIHPSRQQSDGQDFPTSTHRGQQQMLGYAQYAPPPHHHHYQQQQQQQQQQQMGQYGSLQGYTTGH
ncbi:related to RPH1 - Transcriptional repressor of PHR1 [Ustilago trichophora]|uniref:[histone H3]-trimethyl-L-lysine(9) demethylase n=1 Tax=Ustilago trichophora TaxID=86804 RepID=A0A5C3EKL8_9BASI|nr:related to RPH1 - Transcriptional repressor of PHR1 [Ustilago trichophora]